MIHQTLDEAMPYGLLSRAQSFAKKMFGAGDASAQASGDFDLKNSSVKAKKIVSQWMSRQRLSAVTPNELKSSGLVQTPRLWDEAVGNAGLQSSVDRKINDATVNKLLIEYLKLLYKHQSAEPDQDAPEPPPMPLTHANVLSFVQKRMNPNQAKLVLAKLTDSVLTEKGEFKINKLISAIKSFTSTEQAEIKKALAVKAKRSKSSTAADSSSTKPAAAPPTKQKIKVGNFEYTDDGYNFVDNQGRQIPKNSELGKQIIRQIRQNPPSAPSPQSYLKINENAVNMIENQLRQKFQQFLQES